MIRAATTRAGLESKLRPGCALIGILSLLALASGAEAQVLSGSYVGDGTNGRAITGLGFQPDIVIISSNEGGLVADERRAVIRTSSMVGNLSKSLIYNDTDPLADRVQSLDSNGFTIGHPSPEDVEARYTCVNHSGVTYYWTAFKAAPGILKLGTYTGNGADDRNITGVGFQPDYVIVMPEGTGWSFQRSSAMAGDQSYHFEGANWADAIQALLPDGFQVGTVADVNGSGLAYHYAAWKAIPGSMNVGSYTGDGADNRSIAGVGFQPEYVVIANGSHQKSKAMGNTTDWSLVFRCYSDCGAANDIQALEADGFQVGDSGAVNQGGSTFYWAAFGTGDCPPLGVTQTGGTITVTAPGSFEVRFNSATGGGLDQFYDLAEDPTRTWDLSGRPSFDQFGLYDTEVESGGNFYWETKDTQATLDLLEATPVRARARTRARLVSTAAGPLAGVENVTDYSVYPTGRAALEWTRTTATTTPYTTQQLNLTVHSQTSGPLNGWAAYSQSGPLPPQPKPAADDFVLMQKEVAGVRTDFLAILSQDWADADSVRTAVLSGADSGTELIWRDGSAGNLPAAESRNLLIYFKPTNFPHNADAAVISRAADYITPDPLAVTTGGPWLDANENTGGGDDFNESEAAYALTFDPVLGLTFDMDGSAASPRYHPFFKIRQWRSLSTFPQVTLETVPLVRDVDYRADVKPLSRAHFAQDLLWHSTLHDNSAVTAPDAGSAGTVNGAVTFVAARYGQGALFDANLRNITFPSAGNFNKNQGAVELWYQPQYAHTDGNRHVIWQNLFDTGTYFLLVKEASGPEPNWLKFVIQNGTGPSNTTEVLVDAAGYSWRAYDWIHLRVTWDTSAALGDQVRIFINGVEPFHTDPLNPYNAATMLVGTNYIGTTGGGISSASGIIDEFHVYDSAGAPTPVAYGGLTSNSNEYLVDGSRNFTLGFVAVDATRRGKYLYLGSDSKFRGLNLTLQTPGAGTVNLKWEFWNGTAWADLECCYGFTDETNHLTNQGTIYWTGDPSNWSAYSVNGGPDLYYVRAHQISGAYTTVPVESLIKTDILLFQYCGDIVDPAQTFDFEVPPTTAVELSSFEARGLSEAVELRWETASELNNLGFHLYRARSQPGPYERVTSSPIPGLGSSPRGASYRYVDSGLANGVTYFYELEDIESTGETKRHGPVSASPMAGSVSSEPPPPAAMTFGDPSAVSLRVVERTGRHLVLELLTGGFSAAPQPDGSVSLSIPGFSEEWAPGAPAIPVRRSWVEAETGRGVRIASVRVDDVEAFSSLRPFAAAAPEVVASPRGTIRAGRRREGEGAEFRRGGLYPEEAAKLLSVGYQGDVRKALLELAPLRWDRSSGKLLLARKLVVTLVFAGRERAHSERRTHLSRSVLVRLSTRENGLYQVSFEELFGRKGRAMAVSSLRLSRHGEPVAFHVEPERDDFRPGSTLFFLSEGESLNPYGHEAVYELEGTAGGVTMPLASAPPEGSPVPFYWKELEREENRYYQAGLLEAEDPWLWDLLFAPATRSYPFVVEKLATSEPASLSVWLQGASDLPVILDHHLRLNVNGVLVGETTLEGKKPLTLEAEIPVGILREGENDISIENVGDTGASYSMVMLDRYRLRYPRRVEAERGRIEGSFTESGVAEVEGAAEGAHVLDLTDQPERWLTGGELSNGRLRFRAEAFRSYLVVNPEAVLRARLVRPVSSGLRSPRNRADYLVVGPRELLQAANALIELRRGQGLESRGVSIEDVFSEFGYGESRPEALREFLSYAFHHWEKPSPRYVLLVGDATYDFKDHLGTGVENQTPPLLVKTSYLWTASDPAYAAVNGEDALPDIAIGRLPAQNAQELSAMVEKILTYEAGTPSMEAGAVLVADNPDRAGDFEAHAEEIASDLFPAEAPRKIYLGRLGAGSTRAAVVEAFDEGASLLSYIGHGGIHLWAQENILDNQGVAGLGVQSERPFVLTLNCLNGYFHFPYFNSLAEELVKADGKGALAAISPSGFSLDGPAHVFHKALLREMVSGEHPRLGDAVVAAQADYAASGYFPELLRIYHLLGDPAIRLR